MKRIVVKIGSSVITAIAGDGALTIDRNALFSLARELSALIDEGREVILVSSGAVAMGMEELAMAQRPEPLAQVQALAAIGQSQLMQLWRSAFLHQKKRVGQVLLTHSDLGDRQRFLNVRATLDSLLAWGVVPVINENDTVMTDEITVGDNDQLAVQVAKQLGGDLLVLLSTVDGLLDSAGERVPRVGLNDDPHQHIRAMQSATGRGGMASKLGAAAAAAHGGIEVVIANGKKAGRVSAAVRGDDVGTRFEREERGLPSRKHWIAYTLKAKGVLHLDAGATAAILERGASVLPVGLTRVDGSFVAGDAVSLRGPDGAEIGRGLVRVSTDELAELCGKKGPPVVHRDDLVAAREG